MTKGEQISALKARNAILRKTLHGIVISKITKTRKSCSLCGAHWDRGELEGHRSFCVLAVK